MNTTVLINNTHTATVHLPAVPRGYDRPALAERALAPGFTPLPADYWERVSQHHVVQSWLACGLLVVVPIEDEAPEEAPEEPLQEIKGELLKLPPLPEAPHA